MTDQLQRFPDLPDDLQDAVALVQSQLGEEIDAVDTRSRALQAEKRKRRVAAIALKVTSVLSALVVALGFTGGTATQVLGGLIAGLAAIERIFANLSRLLAVTSAVSAYERVHRAVVAKHNSEIVHVVRTRDRQPEDSADRLINLCGSLRDQLAKARDQIETMLDENDYENLGRLNLDEQSTDSPMD